MFELTYIYHDCFLLRTPKFGVVFDFWQDPTCKENEIPDFIKELPKELPLYILVSHFHKDHFNKEIFKWEETHPKVHYVISRDVARHIRYMLNPTSQYNGKKLDLEKISIISKGEVYSDSLIDIHCFGSTDEGNSYALVSHSSGLRIFHAGDLNCWTWRDESTLQEIREAEDAFSSELEAIKKEFDSFDIVMFPVDSRIGTGYFEGARKFVEKFTVLHFFPMHFTLADSPEELDQRIHDALDFKKYAVGHGEYIGLKSPYDVYSDENSPTYTFLDQKKKEYSETWFLSAGDTNAEMEMSLPLLVQRLIEISTSHANNLGIGNPALPDHCGWVLSRVAVEMSGYPIVSTKYSIDTWVEQWNRHFSERNFCINDGKGNVFGYARQIWMVLDTHTHANAGLHLLPFREEYLSSRSCPVTRQAKHHLLKLPEEIKENEKRVVKADPNPAEYTFQFSDLDAYRHVNTVRYVSLLMNQFSLEVHDEVYVSRLELAFLDEGAYGMTIEILRSGIVVSDPLFPERKVTEFLLREKNSHNPILFAKVFMESRKHN